ncbi:MAG: hypothetical protein HY078_12690 [Elusimicrobia bacterium]|nr:hypothetical protein [Elusimicrobiota bacterium]
MSARTLSVLAVLALFAAGCRGAQHRADDLQRSIDGFVAAGRNTKDDFIRRFGLPKACEKTDSGERCEWRSDHGIIPWTEYTEEARLPKTVFKTIDTLRVDFDKRGYAVVASTHVRRGGKTAHSTPTFRGRKEEPADGRKCPPNFAYRYGECYPTKPLFGGSGN